MEAGFEAKLAEIEVAYDQVAAEMATPKAAPRDDAIL